MEGTQRLGGFVQRHGHALLVILVGGGGVGRHLQRIQNGDDLVHGKGHAVVELLVSLTGGALAVVLILSGHPQQLILGLIGILLSRVQLCLHGLQLPGLLVEEAILFLGVCRFSVRLGSRCLLRCSFRGGLLGGVGLHGRFFCLRGLFCFFAHSRSSL